MVVCPVLLARFHLAFFTTSPVASPSAPPYKRAMMFVDNSGADIVLGMLPLARELLCLGCEVRGMLGLPLPLPLPSSGLQWGA